MNSSEAEYLSLKVEKNCPSCNKPMQLVSYNRNQVVIERLPTFESTWLCEDCYIEITIKIWVEKE